MPHRDKPVKESRADSVRASIWQYEVSGKGDEAFSVFSIRAEKRYRDSADNWQSTTRFKRADLGDLELVVTPDELSLRGHDVPGYPYTKLAGRNCPTGCGWSGQKKASLPIR